MYLEHNYLSKPKKKMFALIREFDYNKHASGPVLCLFLIKS